MSQRTEARLPTGSVLPQRTGWVKIIKQVYEISFCSLTYSVPSEDPSGESMILPRDQFFRILQVFESEMFFKTNTDI